MLRFSEFAKEEEQLTGKKVNIDNILNQEIVILNYTVLKSKYDKNKTGKCLKLQISLNGEIYVVFTGSEVLLNQAEKYKDYIPFISKIVKVNRYYTFS